MRFVVLAISVLSNIENAIAVDLIGVTNKTIAVIVNESDQHSKDVAAYYKSARMIPDENVIYVSFDNKKSSISRNDFLSIYEEINSQLSDSVQAFVLTWTKPYKVECMSITSAFAMGFDETYCASDCAVTKKSDYFNSASREPYNDYAIRPTMMLAGKNAKDVKQLIDRGVESDYSRPAGDAYLLSTSDKARNVRSVMYPHIVKNMKKIVNVNSLEKDFVTDKQNILFYFTGVKHVSGVAKNEYLPGAIADHLTSAGGALFNVQQMSVLRWLESGVTGSYGAVVEPCNYVAKFPAPSVVMFYYMNGDSLIEAYWKSVSMPGQGLFVGEPLASPFKGCRLKIKESGEYEFNEVLPVNYVERSSVACH